MRRVALAMAVAAFLVLAVVVVPAVAAKRGKVFGGSVRGPRVVSAFKEADLVGTYYVGDGLGVNLTLVLTADHRFTYQWTGCTGVYSKNAGVWRIFNELIALDPDEPTKPGDFMGVDIRFYPVKWGERECLVDERAMPAFAAAAKGMEKEKTWFLDGVLAYSKVDARENSGRRFGAPVLPAQYYDFYRNGPMTATVTAVNRDGTVTLARDPARHLSSRVVLMDTQGLDVELEIQDAIESTTAKVWFYPYSKRAPKVGDKFTTGSGFQHPEGTGSRHYASLAEALKFRHKN